MEFMLDTANLDEIREYSKFINVKGVTSNPSIVKKEGKIVFFDHFKAIREIIGSNTLHIQVVGDNLEDILRESEAIKNHIDSDVYIKVPVTTLGLEAIMELKKRNYKVTATAIYSTMQGYLAIDAGADYIAPYYNRMQNLYINSKQVVSDLVQFVDRHHYNSKLVVASFKNLNQINEAISVGAHSVTVPVDLYKECFKMPSIDKAVSDFKGDWSKVYGENITIANL